MAYAGETRSPLGATSPTPRRARGNRRRRREGRRHAGGRSQARASIKLCLLGRHGRCRSRTSDLLLVRDAKERKDGTPAVTADADFACKRDAFVEWLSADGGGTCTG